ncbi:MAG: hypothetical protein O2951_14970 [Bacteroidetes bacterium]|nr:hypothetical protein [Bacteroidota bacterium]
MYFVKQGSLRVYFDDKDQELPPLIGFNAVAHHSIANWTQKDFRDSAATLNISVLRHPGGTKANYWDWQTGWFQTGPHVPSSLANIKPIGQNRYEEVTWN